jgi:hypothetical protein
MKGTQKRTFAMNMARQSSKLHLSLFKKPFNLFAPKMVHVNLLILNAKVAELADAPDLGPETGPTAAVGYLLTLPKFTQQYQ